MQLLVSIVERGKGRDLREHYRRFGLIHHNQAAGHGTAASHLLDALGFGTSERDVLLTLGPRDTMAQLIYYLKDEDRAKLDTPGIAFTLNLSGMSAILAVALSRLEEMKPERGELFMEQGNHHSLILATVNPGYTDEVMETAREAGARGGTVIRARWTDADEVGSSWASPSRRRRRCWPSWPPTGSATPSWRPSTTATACAPPPRPW